MACSYPPGSPFVMEHSRHLRHLAIGRVREMEATISIFVAAHDRFDARIRAADDEYASVAVLITREMSFSSGKLVGLQLNRENLVVTETAKQPEMSTLRVLQREANLFQN